MTFFIKGKLGKIEYTVDNPVKTETNIVSIVCHPHPLYKGTMNNKVVTTISRAFNNLGIKVYRFNYRGVGESVGVYSEGIGELEDLCSLIDFILNKDEEKKIILSGFSFGGSIAFKATDIYSKNILSLLTVSPALKNFPVSTFSKPKMSWCLIHSIDDEIVPYKTVSNFFTENTFMDATFIRFSNTGHFFHGKLIKLKENIIWYYKPRVDLWKKKI